jgi:hypothetical protein
MSDIVTDTQPQKNQRLEVGLKIQVSRAVQLKEMPWKWAKYSVTTLKEKKQSTSENDAYLKHQWQKA